MALKLGTESKKKVATAAALGVVLVGVVIWRLVGSLGGSQPVAAPAPTNTAPLAASTAAAPVVKSVTANREATKAPHLGSNLDPTLHFEIMQQAENLEYTGRGRNIFSQDSAPLVPIPKISRSPRPAPVDVASVPAGPPPPPPIDLKFFGYSAEKSGVRKAFLLHGEDVFIASEGEVVDHRYKVVKIAPFSVELEDLPYHDTQTISLTTN